MHVAGLWRYPVKSLLGERLERLEVDDRGAVGDRWYAVTDANGKFGSGKTTRRFRLLRGLFDYEARTDGDRVLVRLPDGRELAVGDPELDAAFSERYGEPLRVLPEDGVSHFDAGPLHLLTTASLRWLGKHLGGDATDPRRFRPNVLIDVEGDGLVEDAWLGETIALGDAVVRVVSCAPRCVMPTFRQSELGRRPDVLRRIVEGNAQDFGVYAEVVRPGTISLST
jgi:uncharacterized protein YcbX